PGKIDRRKFHRVRREKWFRQVPARFLRLQAQKKRAQRWWEEPETGPMQRWERWAGRLAPERVFRVVVGAKRQRSGGRHRVCRFRADVWGFEQVRRLSSGRCW